MRKELVKCLRTVTLLGVFSSDGSVVSDILSCLKSMVIMEPDLLLPSIIERAFPSLEGLTETRRTTAMIRALTAAGIAIVSRDVYYPGARYLMPILDLLVPGIDPVRLTLFSNR
jgi:proteasome activator subunit 4